MRRFYPFLIIFALLWGVTPRPAVAQTTKGREPWQLADELHAHLFEAQNNLLRQQPAAASAQLDQAEKLLGSELNLFPAATQTYLRQALTQAHTAVQANDSLVLAVAVGQVEGALFWGSYQLTHQAVTDGDVLMAQQWLLVRDYRPTTRFSRPNADATLAINQLGQLPAAEILARLEADLLDTYQGQLSQLLQTAGNPEQLPGRRAEAAGRAHAYWPILAPAYIAQKGGDAEKVVTGLLNNLTYQVQNGLTAEATQTVMALQTELASFRAAPLSPADQARRASQLLRFLALVPVEYGRGVKENVVLQPFEIQEALTFWQGAQSAFNDLSLALNERNPSQTAALQTQIEQLGAILDQTNRQTAVAHPDEVTQLVGEITAGLTGLFPAAWLEQNSAADFDVLAEVLNQVEAAVKQGDYALAESARLEAYAIFDFGPEPRLLAYNPELVAQIDGLFWQGYNGQVGLAHAIALQTSPAEIKTIRTSLDEALQTAQLTLGDLPNSPFAIALNAAIIVFREGLESVVILAALMASMVGANARYRRPLVLGAVLSLVGTAITWWLAQMVLTSLAQYGEKLEAVVSLIAIGVLLLITNWFFHKTYWNDWMAGFHQQKQQLLRAETGQFLGLVALGFTSMYREGFETVLFLQALVLDAGPSVVGQGVLFGSMGVLVVGLITFRVQQRLPYRQMLVWTGILIGLVLVTMVGKTVHVLQAVGWIGITPIQAFTFPYWWGLWFGVFATWQGVVWQILAAVFVVGSYYGAEWLQSRKRHQLKEQRVTAR